jgi:glycosyltransferase involved in cell wall biosynthesis
VADAISDALASGPELRQAAARAGRELSWKHERERLLGVYESIEDAPTAVVLVRNPASHDGRVLRVARSLRDQGERPLVLAVTSEREPAQRTVVDGVPVRRLHPRSPLRPLRRLFGRRASEGPTGAAVAAPASGGPPSPGVRLNRWLVTLSYYRRAIAALGRIRPRIVHCNDYNTMWPGLAAKYLWGAALVYDSHELWPDRNGRTEPRWWLIACEALFVRAADEVVTTSPGHARAIAARHRMAEPRVVRNLPDASGSNGRPGAGREGEFVYAGAVTTGRGLEVAIEALAGVPGARLLILGPGNEPYRSGLLDFAERVGVADRVELAPAVSPRDVVAEIAGATAGLALIEPVCRSYELSLPNKVFEYLAAGLPIIASDLAVMGPFVREGGVGVAVPPGDPTATASAMREVLDPDRNAELREAVEGRRGGLSPDAEMALLAGLHADALSAGPGRIAPGPGA